MPNSIETPAGKFQILVNGTPVEFVIISPSTHPIYGEPLDISAQICYVTQISLLGLCEGDTVLACFGRGNLKCDGGGENMTNIVGMVDRYVVGLGGYDFEEFFFEDHCIPYELFELVKAGLKYRITKEPVRCSNEFANALSFIIAWQSSDNGDAWDAISLTTS